jgi:hypothetical protein
MLEGADVVEIMKDTPGAGGYDSRVRDCRLDGSVEYVPLA